MIADRGDQEPNVRQDVDDTSTPDSYREYRTGGITVRLPAEPPALTPRAARALLGIIKELTDQKRQESSPPEPQQ